MTAKVAVINMQAIALAADSAVTLSTRYGQSRRAFTHSHKIFELTKQQPIGVMIHGNSQFGNLPIETIIKGFHKLSHDTQYDTVDACKDDFLKFLGKADFNVSNNFMVVRMFWYFYEAMVQRTILRGVKPVDVALDDVLSKLEDVNQLPKPKQRLRRKVSLKAFRATLDEEKIRQTISQRAFDEASFERVKSFLLSKAPWSRMLKVIYSRLQSKNAADTATGMIICGFGEAQYRPHFWRGQVGGCFMGQPRVWQEADQSDHTIPTLIPFAQRDVIDAFIRGISDDWLSALIRSQENIVDNMLHEMAAGFELDLDSAWSVQFREKLLSSWVQGLHQRVEYATSPLRESLSILPKEEMALLAEALVELTSVKRRVEDDVPTVGGPTDVALISKGDGFVWIKRKYYFDEKLNRPWSDREDSKSYGGRHED
jgi:hypothetical protein